jgi:hypothetical protein
MLLVAPGRPMFLRNARKIRNRTRDTNHELTAAHMTAGVPLESCEQLTSAQQSRVAPRALKLFLQRNEGGS